MTQDQSPLTARRAYSEILIDANLLLLLIAGNFDRSLIGGWKRLSMFSTEDFDFLQQFVATRCKSLVVTPHVLTEVSNLANALPQWRKAQWSHHFQRWITTDLKERQIQASEIASNRSFRLFGLTDAALFHASSETCVLTIDGRLAAYLENHQRLVINFNHLRRWILP